MAEKAPSNGAGQIAESERGPRRITRRRLFKWSLGLAAALGVGYGRFGVYERWRGRPLRALGAREAAILAAFVDVASPVALEEARLLETVSRIDRYLLHLPRRSRREIGALLGLLEQTTWWFGPRFARFTRLERADRRAVLTGWERSRMLLPRIALRGLIALMALAHYVDAAAFSPIGYGGPVTPPGWQGPPAAAKRYEALLAPPGRLPEGLR